MLVQLLLFKNLVVHDLREEQRKPLCEKMRILYTGLNTDPLKRFTFLQMLLERCLRKSSDLNTSVYYYDENQCCGARAGSGAGGAATFCWSQSFFGPAPEPGM
jgi:hypothetical protein